MALALGLLLVWPLALRLPPQAGWEGGWLEAMQLALLLAGGGLSVYWGARQAPQRRFWLMLAPLWLMLAVRELSWGAVFLQPVAAHEVTGPQHMPSRQTGFRHWVVATAVAGLVFSLLAFFGGKCWRVPVQLWRARQFPLFEAALVMAASVAAYVAESGGAWVDGRMGSQSLVLQCVEELAELLVYAALLLGQWRVGRGLRVCREEAAGAGSGRQGAKTWRTRAPAHPRASAARRFALMQQPVPLDKLTAASRVTAHARASRQPARTETARRPEVRWR